MSNVWIKRWAWPALLVIFVIALAVGTFTHSSTEPLTQQGRIDHIASEIRCPTCSGLSVLQSQAPLAQSAKQEITSEVAAGKTDAEIRQYFVTRYGASALMSPTRAGFTWTVWLLPFAIGLALVIGVVGAIRKWGSGEKRSGPTESQRRRVELALEKKLADSTR